MAHKFDLPKMQIKKPEGRVFFLNPLPAAPVAVPAAPKVAVPVAPAEPAVPAAPKFAPVFVPKFAAVPVAPDAAAPRGEKIDWLGMLAAGVPIYNIR